MKKIIALLFTAALVLSLFAQDNGSQTQTAVQMSPKEIYDHAVRSVYPENYAASLVLENIKPDRPTKSYALNIYFPLPGLKPSPLGEML